MNTIDTYKSQFYRKMSHLYSKKCQVKCKMAVNTNTDDSNVVEIYLQKRYHNLKDDIKLTSFWKGSKITNSPMRLNQVLWDIYKS